ncbi:hypothetical protein PUNSTDRAFT_42176 [Punctularia strigosozonata HHB-11173 SS5]|uniref:uncharacterized protein n=1 Tax=Punctularia strigosozonata (strain HHB-11173) TaxID=741275 RepID=UPI0004417D20|nr:uncharacterized protein PUNSTDRAFT_42176 [Punctularia strigosozonata HHB-11173 SS5]EIN12614.1 hypothetical protein PUNSTDRAFT_42176 [Punctularia strigosozonata HHB-11173 SS5]
MAPTAAQTASRRLNCAIARASRVEAVSGAATAAIITDLRGKLSQAEITISALRLNLKAQKQKTRWNLEAKKVLRARLHASKHTERQQVAILEMQESRILLMSSREMDLILQLETTSDRNQVSDAVSSLDASQRTVSKLRGKLSATAKDRQILRVQLSRLRTRAYQAGKAQEIISRAQCLKNRGTITESARFLVHELTRLGLPSAHVGEALTIIAEIWGIAILGSISRRSVSRIVLEGLTAAKLQIVEAVHAAEGSSSISTFMLPIMNAPNHQAVTQLRGWEELVADDLFGVWNASPLSSSTAVSALEFPSKVTIYGSDHSSDNTAVARGIKAWKETSDRLLRGEKCLLEKDSAQLCAIVWAEVSHKIVSLGGVRFWTDLSATERGRHLDTAWKTVCRRSGEEGYEMLGDSDKLNIDFFAQVGCCMHKEMNGFKGGCSSMALTWGNNHLPLPISLMNAANAQSYHHAPTDAERERLDSVSPRGGVKAAWLAGEVYNNKDSKKGQHDIYRIHFEDGLSYAVPFPETSSNRYGSYGEAAIHLILRLVKHRTFLEDIRDKKQDRTFTNIEKNLYTALNDTATLTELAAMALYQISVGHQYTSIIRTSESAGVNHLTLGPLHSRLLSHVTNLANNISLLTGSDATYGSACFEQQPFSYPEVWYRIQQLVPELPHLDIVLSGLFKGVADTLPRFLKEFAPDSPVTTVFASTRTNAQGPAAYAKPTNDDNEGSLGSFRQAKRRAPNMTLDQYNGRAMYKRNRVRHYIRTLHPGTYSFIRRHARDLSASQSEKRRRDAIAQYDHEIIADHRRIDADKLAKICAEQARLAQLTLVLEADKVAKLSVKELDDQLDWHRAFTDAAIPSRGRKGRGLKISKQQTLVTALTKYHELRSPRGTQQPPPTPSLAMGRPQDDGGSDTEVDE